MRLINYVLRGIVFFILGFMFALFTYLGTIASMLFCNWDVEYKSIKTLHVDIWEFWYKGTFKVNSS
jgi:hypothetical protein